QLPANSDLAKRLAALLERFAADARDEEFAARFEEIRFDEQTRVNQANSTFTTDNAFSKLRDALSRVEINIGADDPARVAVQIQNRPVAARRQLFAALHECLTSVPEDDAKTVQ